MIEYKILLGIVGAFVLMWIVIIILRPDKIEAPKRQPSIVKEEKTEGRSSEKMPEKPDNTMVISDAIAGLVSLGYKQKDAKSRVERAWELLGNATTEQLIKKAMVI